MKHLIVFGYLLSLLISGGTLTMQLLDGEDNEKYSVKMQPFFAALFIINLCDMIIYYCGNISMTQLHAFALNTFDFLFTILVYYWMRVLAAICDAKACKKIAQITNWLVRIYFVIWIVSAAIQRETQLVRMVTDLTFMFILVIGSAHAVFAAVKAGKHKSIVVFIFMDMLCMLLNYIACFFGNSEMATPPDRKLEFTIFYWLVISITNLTFAYRTSQQVRKKAFATNHIAVVTCNLEHKYELTKREIEILEEICQGKTNGEIAQTLFISESTVKAHIYNAFRKLGVKNRTEAVHLINLTENRI